MPHTSLDARHALGLSRGRRAIGRGLATLALKLAASTLPAAETSGGAPFFRHASFADFATGQVSSPGTGLYVARRGDRGEIRWINRFDYNNDGFPEVVVVNDHNPYDTSPAGLAAGFIEIKARLGSAGSVEIEARGAERAGAWGRLDLVERTGDTLRSGPAELTPGGQFRYRLVLDSALLGTFPMIEEVSGSVATESSWL